METPQSEQNVTFMQSERSDYLIVSVTGVLNTTSLKALAERMNQKFSWKSDYGFIFDIRSMDDQSTNADVPAFVELLSSNRFLLKKPMAILVSDDDIQRSRGYTQNVSEREGFLIRNFKTIEEAYAWIDDPDK